MICLFFLIFIDPASLSKWQNDWEFLMNLMEALYLAIAILLKPNQRIYELIN